MSRYPNPWPMVQTLQVTPPVAILRGYAGLLGERTKNVVLARVVMETWRNTESEIEAGTLRHRLELYTGSPRIDIDLLRIRHAATRFYPCSIECLLKAERVDGQAIEVADEAELRAAVKQLLNNPAVGVVVSALYWNVVAE